MKHRSTQLATRKNPDSPRVHGSRPTVNPSFTSMREFVESQDREDVPSAPSCEIEAPDVSPACLANEITVEKEKRVPRLLAVESVKGVPAKPSQPTKSSAEGREPRCKHLKNDNRFEPLLDVVEAAMLLKECIRGRFERRRVSE